MKIACEKAGLEVLRLTPKSTAAVYALTSEEKEEEEASLLLLVF